MKIISSMPGAQAPATPAAAEVTRTPAPARASQAPSSSGALQYAVLQPALEAMRELPEIDHARVAALRDALSRGELPFDAGKLAALIERYHASGSRK